MPNTKASNDRSSASEGATAESGGLRAAILQQIVQLQQHQLQWQQQQQERQEEREPGDHEWQQQQQQSQAQLMTAMVARLGSGGADRSPAPEQLAPTGPDQGEGGDQGEICRRVPLPGDDEGEGEAELSHLWLHPPCFTRTSWPTDR